MLDYVEARGIPTVVRAGDAAVVKRALGTLVREGVVTEFTGGTEPVYAVAPGKHVEVAFYRNNAVHHFVMLDQRPHARHAPQGTVDLFEDASRVAEAGHEVAGLRPGHNAGGRRHPFGHPGRVGRGTCRGPRENGDDAAHRDRGYGLGGA